MLKQIVNVCLLAIILSSCASIASKSTYPISITSPQTEVHLEIKNRKNQLVYSGSTPASLNLEAASGYFKREIYTIRLSKAGYEPLITQIHTKIDGWYWGNLIIGGWIGMLVIDPATGAMYKLPQEHYSFALKASPQVRNSLQIIPLNDVPPELQEKLILLGQAQK